MKTIDLIFRNSKYHVI